MNEELKALLDEVFKPEDQQWWLNQPHDRWGDDTPQEVANSGRGAEVEAYLAALAEGVVM